MNKRLKYEKYRSSDNIITIDLHNGYTVIAITTYENDKSCYITTLLLKDNTFDDWKLIEGAEKLEFNATPKTINSAILKQVSDFLDEGFFDYYIQRYEYETKCCDIGDEIMQNERLSDTNVS